MSIPSNGKSGPFSPSAETAEVTADAFFNGRLKITQMRRGYRFSIDAVLLAGSIAPKSGQLVVDLGTGCGVIPLILSCRYPDVRLYGVELQSELAELANTNIGANHLESRFSVIHGDMRQLAPTAFPGPVDWVIANPPYRRPGSGRINPNSQKALARHEIHLNLAELIQTAYRLLRTSGWFATIYPAERTVDLLATMHHQRIEPKWLRTIHSYRQEPAKLVMVQGVKGGQTGMVIDPPIIMYEADGSYTPTVQAMMRP